jgi:hypothetical protein
MKLYGGIDLHSNNSYIVLIDSGGTVVQRSRVGNDLGRVLQSLSAYQEQIDALAVESTYNWYWLVDGLKAAGYGVKLANPSAMEPYQGLKHSDDRSVARWLAEMLRLGILPRATFTRKRSGRCGNCCDSGAFWSGNAPVNCCTPAIF